VKGDFHTVRVEVDAGVAIIEITEKIEVRLEQEARTVSIWVRVGHFWLCFYRN
jgi:hypothetical protein